MAELCYTYTDSFIVLMNSEDIYTDFPENDKKRFEPSSYEVKRLLPIRKTKENWVDEGCIG